MIQQNLSHQYFQPRGQSKHGKVREPEKKGHTVLMKWKALNNELVEETDITWPKTSIEKSLNCVPNLNDFTTL